MPKVNAHHVEPVQSFQSPTDKCYAILITFPNDVRRASSSDMIEPGIVVFFGMILFAVILAFIVPKNEDEIF